MQQSSILLIEEESKGGDHQGADKEIATTTSSSSSSSIVMEVQHQGIELELFWPLQHPLQPDDEDRPVICPMPLHSSLPQQDGRMHGKRTPESWRKRAEVSRELKPEGYKEEGGRVSVSSPSVRAMRKRHHHTLSHPTTAEHSTIISPLPLPTTTAHPNITIFQMLQHLDE